MSFVPSNSVKYTYKSYPRRMLNVQSKTFWLPLKCWTPTCWRVPSSSLKGSPWPTSSSSLHSSMHSRSVGYALISLILKQLSGIWVWNVIFLHECIVGEEQSNKCGVVCSTCWSRGCARGWATCRAGGARWRRRRGCGPCWGRCRCVLRRPCSTPRSSTTSRTRRSVTLSLAVLSARAALWAVRLCFLVLGLWRQEERKEGRKEGAAQKERGAPARTRRRDRRETKRVQGPLRLYAKGVSNIHRLYFICLLK